MSALAIALLIYLLAGISLLGWGRVIGQLLRLDRQAKASWPEAVWLGLGLAFVLFQLVHLVLPIRAYATVPLMAVGFFLGVREVVQQFAPASRMHWGSRSSIAMAASVFLVGGWIALRSIIQIPEDYDSGLYHFSAIRWIRTYPLVAGLGNLHGRLAFNSAFFVMVAALDFEPLLRHGHQLANSFLLVLAIATAIAFLRRWIPRLSSLRTEHPFRYGGSLFVLPPLAYLALSRNLASPIPDLASTILQLVIFVFLCDGIGQWQEGGRSLDHRAATILVLSATAITIKLSNLAFAFAAGAFAVAYLWKTRAAYGRMVRIALPAAVAVLIWSFRGMLLSGAPFYPSTIGYVEAEWAVPKQSVIEEGLWIRSWGRSPGEHWTEVLGNANWLRPWLLERSEDFLGVVYPLGLSAVLCAVAAAGALRRKLKEPARVEWAVLVIPIAGLAYWFVLAPGMRFANALFFLTSLASCLLILVVLRSSLRGKAFAAAACILFLIGNYHFLRFAIDNKWALKPCATLETWVACIPSASWRPIPEAPLVARQTSSGLTLFTPAAGDQCWDAPLPCTPYFNDALKTAEPGMLSSGFWLESP